VKVVFPEIFTTYEEIAKLPGKVRSLYEDLGIKIRQGGDLEKHLKLCSGLDEKTKMEPEKYLLDVSRAKRVLETILACEDEEEIKENLKRIAEHSLKTNTDRPSLGKDSLFELELLQYMKHRGLKARLGEPDIVIEVPFGEYYIACKTINSLKNFEKQLSSGCKQINMYGKGCIAFNLEPHTLVDEPVEAYDMKDAGLKLEILIKDIISKKKYLLINKLIDNSFDGVIFQMTCVVKFKNSASNLDTFTYSYYFNNTQCQENEASDRFGSLVESMKGEYVNYIS